MKNTLNDVIETLESKGYEFEYDETVTVLEITSPSGAYEDITTDKVQFVNLAVEIVVQQMQEA